MEQEEFKTTKTKKRVIEFSTLVREPRFSKNLENLTPEEISIAKSLSLEIEIHPDLRNHSPNPEKLQIWSSFTFKKNNNSNSLLVVSLNNTILLLEKDMECYKTKETAKDDFQIVDCVSGKNCYFLFSYLKGIFKKLHHPHSLPSIFYSFMSWTAIHGENIRISEDKRLLFLNKNNKDFVTFVLKNDRIEARIKQTFHKVFPGSKIQLSGKKFLFFGNNVLLILLEPRFRQPQKLGVIRYRAKGRKKLVKNILIMGEGKKVQSIKACPKSQYLCCFTTFRTTNEPSEHQVGDFLEIYELSKRLDSIRVVASCKAEIGI